MAETTIRRFRTAMRRFRLSRPIALAWEHGLIRPGASVFDYGCGRGDDIRYLRDNGVAASGWDPHYRPQDSIREADVVNLGYVLNVIENPAERGQVLRKAFSLARRVLVAAVRVDRGPLAGEAFEDGRVTAGGGFQKVYTQAEFQAFLEAVCGRKPAPAGLGIAYVFKDAALEREYLARASLGRSALGRRFTIAEFQSSDVGAAYLDLARKLTRLPRPGEFPQFAALAERFGSSQRIRKLAAAALDPAELENLRCQKRENFLVYYAAVRLRGLPAARASLLPAETQADIRALWPSYRAARADGERFLFSLGDPRQAAAAAQAAPVGKLVAGSLYAHGSAEEQLPALNRLQLFAARQIVGDAEYDVLKLSADGKKVSFLRYPRFDADAHPALHSSLAVWLPNADYSFRDFSLSQNPPILHRKDALVDETYPLHRKFAALTRQEEKRALLSRSDIGRKKDWERLLLQAGLEVRGHRLFRRKPARPPEPRPPA